MTTRVRIPVRLLSVLFVALLGLTACGSDSDSTEEQGSQESTAPEGSAEPAEPADAYQEFVAAIEGDNFAAFTEMLVPEFGGLEAEGVGTCEYGETDPEIVFGCLAAASASGDLALAPEPEWTMTIRDGLGQQFSGSELDAEVTGLLDGLGEFVGEEVVENNVRITVAPKAFQDGTDLNVWMVLLDGEWEIILLEQAESVLE